MTNGFMDIARLKFDRTTSSSLEHAQEEAAVEQVSVDDIKQAILMGQELEPYFNDPRGPSCLMVGQDERSRWIHVLCGNFDRENLLIITVYLPLLPKWKDPFTRG